MTTVSATLSENCSPGTLRFESAGDHNATAWNDFLEKSSTGSFYHLYEWKGVNQRQFNHDSEFLIARDATDTIVGVLPLILIKSRIFGRILCSMPFVNFGGPVASSPYAAAQLIEQACQSAKSLKAHYLELRCAVSVPTDLQCSLRKVSMSLALDSDPEKLWSAFSSKHRTNIRRAQKNDLSVTAGGGELLDDFYRVMEQSWKHLGTPLYSREYFRNIVDTFGDRIRIFVCKHRDQPVAVAFNGHFNKTVEGMWAGALPESRNLQPNYVLYWEMMRDACTRGYRSYHLGRSTADSGAEQFKSKWNAETKQLYWYFFRPDGGAMPELNVDNPKYQLAINMWRKLPLWSTRILGPQLSRSIP